jgi:protein-tyrosine phosphatase
MNMKEQIITFIKSPLQSIWYAEIPNYPGPHEDLEMVDSAGTANYHVGVSPDHRMIETGNKFGTSIHALKGRQFCVDDFDKFDVIYAMDKSNFSNILSLAQTETQVAKVRLLFDEVFPKSGKEVPDPYYGTMADFESVYHLLDDLTEQIKNKLINDKTR